VNFTDSWHFLLAACEVVQFFLYLRIRRGNNYAENINSHRIKFSHPDLCILKCTYKLRRRYCLQVKVKSVPLQARRAQRVPVS